eukprot:TRINITY_DN5007_c0_g2_i2.p1 TRINITY_DN5007_c0_g2~~TRINITY_DN5007_c0_g2_i2.p1  ORF type:complete len:133 (+),score=24.42 TRINITY_DN5007_c0_g2_i2:71-469(+)
MCIRDSIILGGKHTICFNNFIPETKDVPLAAMSVEFEQSQSLEQKPLVKENSTQEEKLNELSIFSKYLEARANELGLYQEYEIEKAGEFKNIVELTNNTIQWCAIVQTIVFCGLGLWQIISLRSFFSKRGLA